MTRLATLFAAFLLVSTGSAYAQRGWGQWVPRHTATYRVAPNMETKSVSQSPAVTEMRAKAGLQVSLNPVGKKASLQLGNEPIVSAQAVDASGRTFYLGTLNNQADVSALRPGAYLIQVITESGTVRTDRYVKS